MIEVHQQQKQILQQLQQVRDFDDCDVRIDDTKPGILQSVPLLLLEESQGNDKGEQAVAKENQRRIHCYHTFQGHSRYGSFIVFESRRDQIRTVHQASATIRLPWVLYAYALDVQASLTFSLLQWPQFFRSISFKNIVPRRSSFMVACDKGQYVRARDLAIAGRGRPTDVDEDGQPALHVRQCKKTKTKGNS